MKTFILIYLGIGILDRIIGVIWAIIDGEHIFDNHDIIGLTIGTIIGFVAWPIFPIMVLWRAIKEAKASKTIDSTEEKADP